MIAFLRRHPVAALGVGAVVFRVAFFAVPDLSDSLPRKTYSRAVGFAVAAEALLDGRGGQVDAARVSEVYRAWSASGARLPPPPAGVPATAAAAWIDSAEEKGYVLLHAGWALVRGEVEWSGVLLLQALLSGLCVLLVGTAGGWVVDERCALLAAAVYALHPLEIWASATPDLPVWAVYSAVAACVVALTPVEHRGAGPYARSMLLGGLVMFCAVVRSTNLAFLAAASLILWIRTGRRAWRHQVAFCGAAVAVLAVCAAAPPKTPTVGRSVMYHNLLGGLGEFGDIEGLRWDDGAIRSYLLKRYGVTSHTPEYEEAARRAYEDTIRANPSLPLVVSAKRLAWLVAGYRAGRSPWTLVAPLLVLKLAVLYGLWAWWRKRRSTSDVLSFLAVALTPIGVHVLVVPLLAIYLLPTIVLLSIPAAGGVFGMLAGASGSGR